MPQAALRAAGPGQGRTRPTTGWTTRVPLFCRRARAETWRRDYVSSWGGFPLALRGRARRRRPAQGRAAAGVLCYHLASEDVRDPPIGGPPIPRLLLVRYAFCRDTRIITRECRCSDFKRLSGTRSSRCHRPDSAPRLIRPAHAVSRGSCAWSSSMLGRRRRRRRRRAAAGPFPRSMAVRARARRPGAAAGAALSAERAEARAFGAARSRHSTRAGSMAAAAQLFRLRHPHAAGYLAVSPRFET